MTNTTKRNIIGFIGWVLLTILLTPIITLPTMIYREYRQSEVYGFPVEEEDIFSYSLAILIGFILQLKIIMLILVYELR